VARSRHRAGAPTPIHHDGTLHPCAPRYPAPTMGTTRRGDIPTDRTSSLSSGRWPPPAGRCAAPGRQHRRPRRCATPWRAMPTNTSPHRRWLVAGTAVEVTVAEPRPEAVLPADEATASVLTNLGRATPLRPCASVGAAAVSSSAAALQQRVGSQRSPRPRTPEALLVQSSCPTHAASRTPSMTLLRSPLPSASCPILHTAIYLHIRTSSLLPQHLTTTLIRTPLPA
jgi:hypothetical protein